jgi:hypothetical protein
MVFILYFQDYFASEPFLLTGKAALTKQRILMGQKMSFICRCLVWPEAGHRGFLL